MSGERRRINKLFAVLTALWIGFVLYINNEPGATFASGHFRWWHRIPHFDKIVHFGLYGVMTALLWNAVLRIGRDSLPVVRRPLLFIALVPAMIGVLDEVNQYFVPGRSSDPADLLADWAAVAAAMVAMRIFRASFFVPRAS